MNEAHSQLLPAARAYVTDLFIHKVKPEFVFHSLEHTEDVVEASSRIADHYHLTGDDRFVLLMAAWFHDTGYLSGQSEGHEEASTQIATQFLSSRQVPEDIIQRISSCIRATRMPQSPASLTEQILCDADLFHLSTSDFKARSQLLKQERESLLGHKIDKKEWRKSNIRFLEGHSYFTDYAKQYLEPQKMAALQQLKNKKGAKPEEKKEVVHLEPELEEFPFKTEPDTSDAKEKNTERGIQTMFRTTSNNHIELSGMADNKANLLITVNSIILSVTITAMLPRILAEGDDDYTIPTVLLVLSCLITITLAILATRPSISRGRFSEEDIRNKKTNLLFFGNFHRMSLQDYQWGMRQMLRDKEYLYNTMTMDIYYLGVVLARKYKLLRIAYTVFMVGLIISAIAFAVASLLAGANTADTGPRPRIDYP